MMHNIEEDEGRRWRGILTIPTCLSTVDIRLLELATKSFDMTSFSTANTTPSLHLRPMAVPPFSTAFAAYSTYCMSNSQLAPTPPKKLFLGGDVSSTS